ncbi:MAG: DUF2784 domain-containing protein [Azospirillaceae bacterium]|nr:DUF2784 domain-containing protein [Azospirillaceae bacterium]
MQALFSPPFAVVLAGTVLALHVGVILFNLFGLVAVPLGAWRGWRFVRVTWWRVLHLLSLAVVAAQAVAGRACILTLWQAALEDRTGQTPETEPLIQHWVEQVIFWPLPGWVFLVLYIAVLVYAAALWWLVPPRRSRA